MDNLREIGKKSEGKVAKAWVSHEGLGLALARDWVSHVISNTLTTFSDMFFFFCFVFFETFMDSASF